MRRSRAISWQAPSLMPGRGAAKQWVAHREADETLRSNWWNSMKEYKYVSESVLGVWEA